MGFLSKQEHLLQWTNCFLFCCRYWSISDLTIELSEVTSVILDRVGDSAGAKLEGSHFPGGPALYCVPGAVTLHVRVPLMAADCWAQGMQNRHHLCICPHLYE